MREFFEFLARLGLTEDRLDQTLGGWRPSQLSAFMDEYTERFPAFAADTGESGPYSFIANTGLSGGPFPCVALDCRLRHVDQLGRFAALYPDHVLVRDPLENLAHQNHMDHDAILDLSDGLRVLYALRPLFEAGVVGLASGTRLVCPGCYRNLLIEGGISPDRFTRAKSALSKRFFKEARFVVRQLEDGPYLEIKGSGTLLEHTRGYVPLGEDWLLKKKEGTRLSAEEVRRAGALASFVEPIIDDIALQNLYSHRYGVAYLTDRQVDFEVLRSVNQREDDLLNQALFQGLSHDLPVVRIVSLQDLLRLREAEGEAFKVYRDAMRAVLKNIDKPTPAQVREAFQDIVQPEIDNIDKAVWAFRKSQRASIRTNLIGAGLVGIGYFTGFLPPEINSILAALGGAPFVHKLLDQVVQSFQEPAVAAKSKYYYLWKVQEKAYKSRPRFILKPRD